MDTTKLIDETTSVNRVNVDFKSIVALRCKPQSWLKPAPWRVVAASFLNEQVCLVCGDGIVGKFNMIPFGGFSLKPISLVSSRNQSRGSTFLNPTAQNPIAQNHWLFLYHPWCKIQNLDAPLNFWGSRIKIEKDPHPGNAKPGQEGLLASPVLWWAPQNEMCYLDPFGS